MALDTQNWKIIEAIFCRASELSEQARDDYLNDQCGENRDFRRQIEELLEADENPDRYLDQPFVVGSTESSVGRFQASELTHVGRYKLLQEIGEGGFGVVYMAEQHDPVRRKVALKIIKPGMDSRAVVARFEAERQALAMMDHPNIARVLDGGTTDAGMPYFVMDLVKGMPITDYCNDRKLTARQRLELFAPVCHAIQHAHQKGIIHRDVKPSNVMITLHNDLPVPKVIDFGVAKALNQQLTEKTLFTNYGAMVGTPQYMSPEQAAMSGIDVDTRSDVYSLGILLYELLAGQPPFDKETLREAGLEGMRNMICNSEPRKPSALVSTLVGDTVAAVGRQRQVDPANLSKLLRGDLDWIVMKAIDKDRTRRYTTAAELAEDVQSYLVNDPVKASPPSFVYRTRKIARRHKVLIGTAAAIFLALSAGIGIATWGWVDAAVANDQLAGTQGRLVDQLTDAAVNATAPQLAPAVENLKPLSSEAGKKLQTMSADETLTVPQRINTSIALGELMPGEKVGDFLLENITKMEGDFCPSLISVLRKTNYDPFQLVVFARKAERARDLTTKSRLAILGLYLGQLDIAQDMLQCGLDPIQRTTMLSVFADWHGGLSEMVKLVDESVDSNFRSGVIQLVGAVDPKSISQPDRKEWLTCLKTWHDSAPDLLTRNSAEWALRRLGAELPSQTPVEPSQNRDWFVNSVGITMRHIDPGRFTMGSWNGNLKYEGWEEFHDETPHQVELTHSYFLADREMTAAVYQIWAESENMYSEHNLEDNHAYSGNLEWLKIRWFCNWLSRKEGLEECYFLDQERRGEEPTNGWTLRPDANGYRLPTEAEWEYACRAGTVTDYSWGQSTRFARMFVSPPKRPCGQTLPNSWGLFDMHGNLVEPCEDRYGMYPLNLGLLTVTNDPLVEGDGEDIVVRGRFFRTNAYRSSSRDRETIDDAIWPDDVGLRIARTATASGKSNHGRDDQVREQALTRLMRLNDPQNVSSHLGERGICRARLSQPAQAADDFTALLQLMEPYEDWGALRTQFLTQLASESAIINELSARLPEDGHLALCRARNAAFAKDWERAADFVEPILRKRDQRSSKWRVPLGDQEWHEMALYLLHANRLASFQRYRSWMIDQVEEATSDSRHQWTVLKAATLAPMDDLAEQKAVLAIAIGQDDKWGGARNFPPYWFALYRAGKMEDTLKYCREQLAVGQLNPRLPFFLAMATWRSGHREQARAILADANRDLDQQVGQLSRGWPAIWDWWDDYLSRNLFLAEAERMIVRGEQDETQKSQ